MSTKSSLSTLREAQIPMLLPHVLSELVISTVSLPMALALGTTVNGTEIEHVVGVMNSPAVSSEVCLASERPSAVSPAAGEGESRASELPWNIWLTRDYLRILKGEGLILSLMHMNVLALNKTDIGLKGIASGNRKGSCIREALREILV